MIIASVNVNGIRAATKVRNDDNPGMLAWLNETAADVVLMQEVRATVEQAETALEPALNNGWNLTVAPAAAKGRAGVGILSRSPLSDVQVGFGSFDDAGRYLEGTVEGLRVASLYLPSGSTGSAKQDEKYYFLDEFTDVLADKATTFDAMVIGGDWNICHREQDLKNSRPNRKKSGHLDDERAWMDSIFGAFPDDEPQDKPGRGDYLGVVDYPHREVREATEDPQWFDIARRLQPDDAPYTWWTYRGQAFNNNAGWRIDYQAGTKKMLDAARRSWVEKASSVETRWSDHSPLLVDYDI
ncbi:exodeoxyribonuclease III [Corynebacterium yudongzhengii]|uniref:Exodeoxyribonuclease III n=1 Tax=Corynebacterium yudongzhengii TaxID=2080740 RepID=A0A2U1T736_9CORY|nr:exodeoxyribonuclease III [Corynebacterium yudongzhengii]AWB81342.1 exodeoxyribonuclease III [Corynebacterium yudongzhengii]PWC01785.1 exodeoxyribonuclease III [Corynebacterium yudongzhengii]